MNTVDQLPSLLQWLFGEEANRLARLSLPLELAVQWPGGGNQNRARAGMKVQVVYEWQHGQLGLSLHLAVTHDRS